MALSTDCDDMSHAVYSHDGITACNDVTSEVDHTLGTCPTSALCATCTHPDLVHLFLGAL